MFSTKYVQSDSDSKQGDWPIRHLVYSILRTGGLYNLSTMQLNWLVCSSCYGLVRTDNIQIKLSLLTECRSIREFPVYLQLFVYLTNDKINAETTAGGIAHWATSLVAGELRTNATDFQEAWTPYIDMIANTTVPNQITHGGPIIGKSVISEMQCSKSLMICQLYKLVCSDQWILLRQRMYWYIPDNEYSQNPISRAEYFAELEDAYIKGGVVVPL